MRAFVLYVLKLLLAVAVVAYVAETVAWSEIAAAARTADARWIGVALALLPLNLGLEAYRWHRLVRRIAPAVRFPHTLAAVLSGYPLGLVTPGRMGDFVGRAFYLRHATPGKLAALTLAERVATLAVSLTVGFAALIPFLATRTATPTWAWVTMIYVGLGALGLVGALAVRPNLMRRLLTKVVPDRFAPHLSLLDAFGARDVVSLVGLSALRYAIFSLQFVVLVAAFEPGVAWALAAWGVVLVFFAKSTIPTVTLAGLGIREGAAVYFLGVLGVSGAAAFNAALAVFCINLLLPSLAGLPFVLKLRFASRSAEVAA